MVFEVIALANDAVSKLDVLLPKASSGDSTWSNEVCRAINVIDKVLRGSYNLFAEIEATKIGGLEAEKYVFDLRVI